MSPYENFSLKLCLNPDLPFPLEGFFLPGCKFVPHQTKMAHSSRLCDNLLLCSAYSTYALHIAYGTGCVSMIAWLTQPITGALKLTAFKLGDLCHITGLYWGIWNISLPLSQE